MGGVGENFWGSYGDCSKFATLETMVAIVQPLQASQNGGSRIADAHGLVRVFAKRQKSETEFRIVDISTVTGQAHLIPDGDGRRLVNSRIDLRTSNDIY